MMHNQEEIVRKLYRKLLNLYPQPFKDRLGESMQQTFNDLYQERRKNQSLFVLWVFVETASEIPKEHLLLITQGYGMKNITVNPKLAALIGLLFAAPFVLLNAIVGNRIEPFFSLIRPGVHTGPFEYILLLLVLLLIPFGAFIAIRPTFQKGTEGKRKFYFVNAILATLLLIIFVMLSFSLGSEIYRCDVLQIPNCD